MEDSISELKETLDLLKEIPTDIDVDVLIEISKIPKSILKEAKKEIEVPDEIKKEYNDFAKQLKNIIKKRKREERTISKNLKKEIKKLSLNGKQLKKEINKLTKEFNKNN